MTRRGSLNNEPSRCSPEFRSACDSHITRQRSRSGIARAAVDVFIELRRAQDTCVWIPSAWLSAHSLNRHSLGPKGRLRAGRAWVLDECDHAWERASRHGALHRQTEGGFSLWPAPIQPRGVSRAVESVVEARWHPPRTWRDIHSIDFRRKRHCRAQSCDRSHPTCATKPRLASSGLPTPSFLFDLP